MSVTDISGLCPAELHTPDWKFQCEKKAGHKGSHVCCDVEVYQIDGVDACHDATWNGPPGIVVVSRRE